MVKGYGHDPRPAQIRARIRAATAVAAADEFVIQETDSEDLVNVARVPIVEAGVEYILSTGPATFTPDDLRDFVTSQDDPAIKSPRAYIGHEDDIVRFARPATGEPALGVFKNIQLDEDSLTVYGDIIGMPKWLAEILPTAYPNRSIEGYQNFPTNTGNTWGLVVEAVALLGVRWPGVSTLDDLPIIFSAKGPEGVELTDGEEANVAQVAAAPAAVVAAVNVDDVRRSYYDNLNSDQTWWWIRAIYLNPNELIVDDDDGTLYRVPFVVSGDEVTFKDPQPVKIQYVDASSNGQAEERRAIALVASAGHQTAVFASRSESRPESNREENVVGVNLDALRQRLGLPADATEEQINAALAAEPETPDQSGAETTDQTPAPGTAPAAPEGTGTPAGETTPAETEPEASQSAPETAQAAGSTVTVDRETWEQTQRNAALGAQAHQESVSAARGRLLDDAIRAGKFPPSRREHWSTLLENDPEGTTQTIASLAENTVPVTARGSEPGGANLSDSAYPTDWLSPEERARVQAADQPVAPITQEA